MSNLSDDLGYIAKPLAVGFKLREAIAGAKSHNSMEQAPWTIAPLWVAGKAYYAAYFVRNTAGDMYQMHPNQGTGNTPVTSGANMPTHKNNQGVYDGGGTSGCLWFYRGTATGVDIINPLMGSAPNYYGDTMTGYLTIMTAKTAWSASSCTIAAGVLTIGGTLVGGSAIAAIGSCIYSSSGTALTSGTQIIGLLSGSQGATGSTYQLRNATGTPQTIAVAQAMSWGGVTGTEANGGLNLTQVITPSSTLQPYTLRGCPINTGTSPFTPLGPNVGTNAIPNYNAAVGLQYSIAFETNARWIFIQTNNNFLAQPTEYDSISNYLKIKVNGRLLSLNRPILEWTAPTGNTNGFFLDLSKFPVSPNGINSVEFYCGNSLSSFIYKIYISTNDVIYPSNDSTNLRISVEGDSTVAGGNGVPYDYFSRWTNFLGELLGCQVYNNAQGSTGFVNTYNGVAYGTDLSANGGSKTNYFQRRDRINLFAPHVHIVCGSGNDITKATNAQYQAAVITYEQAFHADNPNSILIFAGMRFASTTTQITGAGNLVDLENAIGTAVTTINNSLTFFVPTMTDPNGDVINSTGWWAGGGGVGKYFYLAIGDGHPLPAEGEMFARRLAMAIRSIAARFN